MPRSSEPGTARVGRLAAGLGAVFVVVGVFAVVSPWMVRNRDLAIDADGSRAVATIEAVAPSLAEGGDGDFTISYRFVTADGREQRATRAVSEELWRTATKGQPVDVLYATDAPANNHPAGFGQTSIGLAVFVSCIGLVVGGFGVVIVLGYLRPGSGG